MQDSYEQKCSSLVSIIIPTFNRRDLLLEAIQSVINQSYTNIEVIVIDDGSTDESSSYVRKFDDKRIRLVSIRKSGRSHARNVGLELARGDYITFLDSDDLYLRDKIEKQVKYLKSNPEFEVVYSSASCFLDEDKNRIVMEYTASQSGNIYEQIALYLPMPICLPTVMMARRIFQSVGYFDTNLDRFEDTDYWRRISKRFKFGVITDSTCLIRTHSGNTIDNLSAHELRCQVTKYISKVFREDFSLDKTFLVQASRNLVLHYAQAICKSGIGVHEGLVLYLYSKTLKMRLRSIKTTSRLFRIKKWINEKHES